MNDFVQNRPRTEQTYFFRCVRCTAFEHIHTLDNVGRNRRAFRHRRMSVILVHQCDVVVHVFLFAVHAAHAILHDDRQFV